MTAERDLPPKDYKEPFAKVLHAERPDDDVSVWAVWVGEHRIATYPTDKQADAYDLAKYLASALNKAHQAALDRQIDKVEAIVGAHGHEGEHIRIIIDRIRALKGAR